MDPTFLRCLVSSKWQEKCDHHAICVCCKRHFCVMTLMHFLIISHQKSTNHSTTVLSHRLNVENWDWSCEWNKFNQQWTLKLMNGTQFRDKLELLTLFKWGLIWWIIMVVILSIKCSATRLSPVGWLEMWRFERRLLKVAHRCESPLTGRKLTFTALKHLIFFMIFYVSFI